MQKEKETLCCIWVRFMRMHDQYASFLGTYFGPSPQINGPEISESQPSIFKVPWLETKDQQVQEHLQFSGSKKCDNNMDVLQMALKKYRIESFGNPFTHHKGWYILRNCTKWTRVLPRPKQKALKSQIHPSLTITHKHWTHVVISTLTTKMPTLNWKSIMPLDPIKRDKVKWVKLTSFNNSSNNNFSVAT